jgi:cytochrome P450
MKKPTFSIADPLLHPSKEFLANPYATFAKMRAEAPVLWSDKGKYWLVSRYDDVNAVLRDLHYEKGFNRWKTFDPILKLFPHLAEQLNFRGKSMLNQNPPDHTRLRSLVNKAFTPAMVNDMRQHIQEIADGLLDAVADKGQMDLIADFAFVLPVTVIAEMLGIPPADRDKFKDWSHGLTEALEPSAAAPKLLHAAQCNKELTAYLKPLVEERRKSPKDDLISALVQAEEEGSKLSELELMANLVLLLVAGHETTVNLIGNSMLALMRHQDQFNMLKAQPDLMDSAIDEFLRFDSPVQMIRRNAGSALQLGGQQIAEDDTVILLPGSANHDPAQFESPETLDITRKNNKYLSFGSGIHHCLGSSLARAEGKIALTTLMQRLPNIKLRSNDLEYRLPFALRGVKALPVTF